MSQLIKPTESVFIQCGNMIFRLFIVYIDHSKRVGLKLWKVRELTLKGYEITVFKFDSL